MASTNNNTNGIIGNNGHAENEAQQNSTITNVSWLLENLQDVVDNRHLTVPFKRKAHQRIFVNRALQLDNIKFFGFDMDYTLAEYASPDYEALSFDLTVKRLVSVLGYPAAIAQSYSYDPCFPIRGLWFDKLYGNLLKVDQFGNILQGFHGFRELRPHDILEKYPNKFVLNVPKRIYILNTLYQHSEIYILASIVDYFNKSAEADIQPTGIKTGDLFISYQSVFNDVRRTIDHIHFSGELQKETIKDLPKYVVKDPSLKMMLRRLRQHAKVFILTNSDYEYTNAIMKYLLEDPEEPGVSWTSFFDVSLVDARKPSFFEEGSLLRQVDMTTGALAIGSHTGTFVRGQVYSGGSCDTFSDLIGAKGRDVLYVGDHIFGDILKSKKKRGWRTYLVVPELHRELLVWTSKKELFQKLEKLDLLLANAYKNMDSSAETMDQQTSSEVNVIKKAFRIVSREMDLAYGVLGSSFRSGGRQTFFANQIQRYADLYAVSCLNLLYYPFSYFFKATPLFLPHESTVDHQSGYQYVQDFDLSLSLSSRFHRSTSVSAGKAGTTARQISNQQAETYEAYADEYDEENSSGDNAESVRESTPEEYSS